MQVIVSPAFILEERNMAVRFDKSRKVFFLTTAHSEYQMKIHECGMLVHTYYGSPVGGTDMSYLLKKVDRGFSGNTYESADDRGLSPDTLPLEYSTYGAGDYRISALSVIADNGGRTADLRYVSHTLREGREALTGLPYVRQEDDKVSSLDIKLHDEVLKLDVDLIYNVFEDKDVITRSAVITNTSDKSIVITKAASACIDFPNARMDLIHFHGRHAMERQAERTELTHDIHTVGSGR